MMQKLLLSILLLTLSACGGPQSPPGPPVVVYASEDDPVDLPALLDAFTADTGIRVAVTWGDSLSNMAAVIGQTGTPADVLISPNVADIWRAAEEGALRPLHGDAVTSVHSILKDPDLFWVGLQRRYAVVAVSPHNKMQADGGYAAFADSSSDARLCLSSIENSINQALIAMLIEDLGLKPAERVVRGWMMNLPVAPFATEAELLAALASGDCDYGIISSSANTIEMLTVTQEPLYLDLSAMGVGRHARNPERAQQLIDWLILNKPMGALSSSNGRNIGLVGWRKEDVMLLAERVGYR